MSSDERKERTVTYLRDVAGNKTVWTFGPNGQKNGETEVSVEWLTTAVCHRRSEKDIPVNQQKTVWEEFNSGDTINAIEMAYRINNSYAKSYAEMGWTAVKKDDFFAKCGREVKESSTESSGVGRGRRVHKLSDDNVDTVLAIAVRGIKRDGNILGLYTEVCGMFNAVYSALLKKNAPAEKEEKVTKRDIQYQLTQRIFALVEHDEEWHKLLEQLDEKEQNKFLKRLYVPAPKEKEKKEEEKPSFRPIAPTELTRLTEIMSKESAVKVTQVLTLMSLTPAGEELNLEQFPTVRAKVIADKLAGITAEEIVGTVKEVVSE